MKINVDGADNPVTGEAAVGIIVRDHGGNPQVMVWRLISNYRDAEEAEAFGMLGGSAVVPSMAESHPGRTGVRLCNGDYEGQYQRKGLLDYLSDYWRHQGDYAESREL
jgi:hypothetical protein